MKPAPDHRGQISTGRTGSVFTRRRHEPDGTEHHLARHTEMPVEISGPGTGIVGINYRVDAIPDDLDESKLEA